MLEISISENIKFVKNLKNDQHSNSIKRNLHLLVCNLNTNKEELKKKEAVYDEKKIFFEEEIENLRIEKSKKIKIFEEKYHKYKLAKALKAINDKTKASIKAMKHKREKFRRNLELEKHKILKNAEDFFRPKCEQAVMEMAFLQADNSDPEIRSLKMQIKQLKSKLNHN